MAHKPRGMDLKYSKAPFLLIFIIFAMLLAMSYIFDDIGSSSLTPQHIPNNLKISKTLGLDCINPAPPPHQHVYYLKTHKTGSSTMYFILARYSASHELVPLLPKGHHINQQGNLEEKQLMLVKNIKKYDMVFSHHVYSPSMMNYLHNDTYRVTSLREPFDNFVSAFLYYRHEYPTKYLLHIPTNDPLTEFLRHPEKYEIKSSNSFTNNRQSKDMGYDLSKGFDDTEYIKQFIKLSDSRFDFVQIMEYFDEGLVIMKRALRWKMEDIIYLSRNKGNFYKKNAASNNLTLNALRRKLHAKFSQADIMLYDFFLNRFKEKMKNESGLEEEVAELREILQKFNDYCDNIEETNDALVIPASKWSNQFQITPMKCKIWSFDFFKLTNFMKERQRSIFSR